ncbi:MAG: ABC transporter ATP-binding protein [Frankia sp.]
MSAPTSTRPGLSVTDLCAGYGRLEVVKDATLSVAPGQWVGIVGRNGVGKTTLLSAICGLRYGRSTGTVTLDDVIISRAPASVATRAGLVLVPDGHRVFGSLTVLENLLVCRTRRVPTPVHRRELVDRCFSLFPVLRRFAGKQAGLLSGGEQQMLSISQALMLRPRVLVLDEPSSALAPLVVADIYAALGELRSGGIGLLVAEQDVRRSLESTDVCHVLNRGSIVLSGPSEQLRTDKRVSRIVLGTEAAFQSSATATATATP